MNLIEHILGICGDHWHLNIYHVLVFFIIVYSFRLWQRKA